MTIEGIIRMAKEAGFADEEIDYCQQIFIHFAMLVAEHEREECAKIVDENIGFENYLSEIIRVSGVINGSWLHEHIRTAINGELEACARIAEMPIGEYEVVVACGTEPAPYLIPQYANWQDIAKAIRARVREKV